MNSVIMSPLIIIQVVGTQTKCVAGCEQNAASFITRCLPHTANPLSTHLTELSPRVAGPERTFFCRRTSNLARGSDVDCLIRSCLKFCQRRAGFSGSLLVKKKRPLFVVIDTGQKGTGHALAIGELFAHSASITIAKKLIGSGTQSFMLFAKWAHFFFLRGDI
jgi:hypothetical protein